MGLNKSRGNMYSWVSHTWNTVKGQCYHDCSYCYMKTWGKLPKVRFDEKELKTDLGKGNIIFVGNTNDMFAHKNPWIGESGMLPIELIEAIKQAYEQPFRKKL